MNSFAVFATILFVAAVSGKPLKEPTPEELLQNENAQYSFSTNIHDKISDLTQERHEERNGLNLEGSYAYSDGYVRRVVQYVADKDGYRVISEQEFPLEGPKVDPTGTATIDVFSHGNHLNYAIQAVPREDDKGLRFA